MVGKSNAKGGVSSVTQYLYGYDLTVANSNPATRVTYPTDVDNANFVPAYMDFANNFFNFGSWGCVGGEKFMPKPCMLNYDGTVAYYLNPMDYSKKMDGTASDVADITFGGNAMMEWGKLYTKRSFADGVYSFRISNVKIDADYECWCNYDKDNNEVDHFYTPIYHGYSDGTRLRSLSGKTQLVSATVEEEITLASANGARWYIEVLADRLIEQDLLTLMSKSTASQLRFGNGRGATSGISTMIGSGTMNTTGMFWGSNGTALGVKVFGMENRWGNSNRRTAGLINANGTQKLKITRGTHDGSLATDYNLDGTGYITLASATPSGTSGGYISSMKNDLPYGRIPITASGSATTYECDSFYYVNTQSNYCLFGGNYFLGTGAGAFSIGLHVLPTTRSVGNGASISYK